MFIIFHSCFKYRFRMCHNARESVLVSKFPQHFQIVLNTVRIHHLLPLFSFSSLQFQIVSNTVRMHHLPSLFHFILCSSKLFQIPSECTIYRPCFIFFSAVPNCFKYHQNAPFTVLVSFYSLQFQIVLNTTRMHHLPSLFHFIVCSSKSF